VTSSAPPSIIHAIGRRRGVELEPDYTSAVYGSLLVTSLVAVQWRSDTSAEYIGLSFVIAVAAFWLTHCWSAIVDRRVRGPVERSQVIAIGLQEAPMLEAAILPALCCALSTIGVLGVNNAVGLALLVSLFQLFLWGLAVGRAAHTRWSAALLIAAVDLALGLIVVVLKVIVLH
jgi:hypothetical protein